MATVKDPICGKDVDTLRARAVGIFGGVTYYFCSPECKTKYVDPRKAPRELPRPSAGRPPDQARASLPPVAAPPAERKDPSLEELPPMPVPVADELDEPLSDLTPARPRQVHSPSVIADVREMKKGSRRWAVIIVILAALVLAAAVLSLRN